AEIGERGGNLLLGAPLELCLSGGLLLLELPTELRLPGGNLPRELRAELLLDLVRDHLGERDLRSAARAPDRIGHVGSRTLARPPEGPRAGMPAGPGCSRGTGWCAAPGPSRLYRARATRAADTGRPDRRLSARTSSIPSSRSKEQP